MSPFSLPRIITRLDRLAAYTLLITIILFAISGFGLTKGIIPQDIASELHLDILGVVLIFAFTIHSSWALHLALKRNRIWNRYTKVLLALFYITIISSFVYVNAFYTPKIDTTTQSEKQVFTKETLSTFNGQNGQPAYVAIDGIVYDFSSLFGTGTHGGYTPGSDLTSQFHSEHGNKNLKKYPVVGVYN